MAKNTGQDYRRGAVRGRSQFQNPTTNDWQKRDDVTGRIANVKSGGNPFKGVRKEK